MSPDLKESEALECIGNFLVSPFLQLQLQLQLLNCIRVSVGVVHVHIFGDESGFLFNSMHRKEQIENMKDHHDVIKENNRIQQHQREKLGSELEVELELELKCGSESRYC